jgi:hypothetical protein
MPVPLDSRRYANSAVKPLRSQAHAGQEPGSAPPYNGCFSAWADVLPVWARGFKLPTYTAVVVQVYGA